MSITQDAIDQATQNANELWKGMMFQLVQDTARELEFFTADDVFERLERIPESARPQTHDNRAFGGVMQRAKRAGYCELADKKPRPSNRESLHSSPLSVWQSLIFRGF